MNPAEYPVGRADFLTKLTSNALLTQDGKEWLTLALDPFHDYNHQVSGYPDADASQTVVSCYQYQADVSAPVGVAGNWDAHIYNAPQCLSMYADVLALDANWTKSTQANPAVTWLTGPLTIASGPAGAFLAPAIPAQANVATRAVPSVAIHDLGSGVSRVIGIGYEVTNTTAPLYRQGALTAYRMPQLGNRFQMVTTNAAGTQAGVATGEMWRQIPSSVDQANVLKGTRTWEAADGAYVTCLQNSVHNPLSQLEAAQIMYCPNSSPGAAVTVSASQYQTVPGTTAAPAMSGLAFNPNKQMPFDVSGLFLTGLSNQTTLTVKLRVYVERAPTWQEPALAVLASPSAAYDVHALALYAQAANMLPPAVKVGENAHGDWWRSVLKVLSVGAVPLGLALNPVFPGASAVGAGINAFSRLLTRGPQTRVAVEGTVRGKPKPSSTRNSRAKKATQPARQSDVQRSVGNAANSSRASSNSN